VASLHAAYRSGTLSPTEVAEEVHAAAVAHAEATAAWISVVDRDRLLGWARELEAGPRDLPLYGVPVAVKDNIDVAGVPTTAACPSFAYVPDRSATAVRRLRAAGALVIGKTNLDQFATGLVGTRSPYGACASVFDPERVAGGSSSGSAVAVADGIVPVALGTDTAGSGRVPAAFNGIVGVKPTRGLISAAGVVPACRSLDCVSVFAADVDGGRRVLAVLAGPDVADPYSRAAAPFGQRSGAPLRIGVPERLDALDAPSAAAWERTVEQAAAAADAVVPVDLDPFLEAGRLLYAGPWLAERRAVVEACAEGDLDPSVRSAVASGARWSAADVFRAQETLAALAARTAETWAGIDVLLVPTAPTHPTLAEVAADPLGVNDRLGTFTTFANLLDLCAVALPATPRPDGMPFGVTLLAPAFADAALLDLAARWPPPTVELAVCGAHMRGLELNGELVAVGARFVRATATAPSYRLYALPGGERPGLVRSPEGAAIDVEVWRLDTAGLGSLLARIPAPLGIGTVDLANGASALGFLCEAHAAADARDITTHGGWRAYLHDRHRREEPSIRGRTPAP
jgi:allophanate hydrolase